MGEPKPRKKPCSKGKDCCGWSPCQESKVKAGKIEPSETTGKALVVKFEEARESIEKKKAKKDKKEKKDKKIKKEKKEKKSGNEKKAKKEKKSRKSEKSKKD